MNLGVARSEQGTYKQVAEVLKESIDLYKALLKAATGQKKNGLRKSLANSLNSLGAVSSQQARYEQAVVAHEEAIDFYRALLKAATGKKKDELRRGLANALTNLGVARKEQGANEQAVVAHEEAIDLFRALLKASTDQNTDRLRERLAAALNNLGAVSSQQARYEQAVVAHEEAIDFYRALLKAATGKKKDELRRGLANALTNLGVARYGQGANEQAVVAYEEAIDLFRALLKASTDQNTDRLRERLAAALNNLGNALKNRGAYDKAEETMEEAVARYNQLFQAVSDHSTSHRKREQLREKLAMALYNLGSVRRAWGNAIGRRAAYPSGRHGRNPRSYYRAAMGAFKGVCRLCEGARRLPGFDPTGVYRWHLVALATLARAHEFFGEQKEARGRRRELLRRYEAYRKALPLRGRLMLQRRVAEDNMLGRLVRYSHSEGRPLEAWHLAERARARTMLDVHAGLREEAPWRAHVSGAGAANIAGAGAESEENESEENNVNGRNTDKPVGFWPAAEVPAPEVLLRHLSGTQEQPRPELRAGGEGGSEKERQLDGDPPSAKGRRPLMVEFFFTASGEVVIFLLPLWKGSSLPEEQPLETQKVSVAWDELKRATRLLHPGLGMRAGSALSANWLGLGPADLSEPSTLALGVLALSVGSSGRGLGNEDGGAPEAKAQGYRRLERLQAECVLLLRAGVTAEEAVAEEAAAKEATPTRGTSTTATGSLTGRVEAGAPSNGEPNDGKPNDGKPNDGKPNDGKPNDGKPNDGKPSSGEPEAAEPGAMLAVWEKVFTKDADRRLRRLRTVGHHEAEEANEYSRGADAVLSASSSSERLGEALGEALQAAEAVGALRRPLLRRRLLSPLRQALERARVTGVNHRATTGATDTVEVRALVETLCALAEAELREREAQVREAAARRAKEAEDGRSEASDSEGSNPEADSPEVADSKADSLEGANLGAVDRLDSGPSMLFSKVIRQMAGILAGRLSGLQDGAEESAARERLLEGSGDLSAKERLAFVRLLRQALAAGLFEGPGGRRLAEALRQRFVDALPAEIGRHFVAPWIGRAEELGATELILIPHGALHALPLEGALAGPGGSSPGGSGPDGDALNGEVPLGERYPTSRAPSAATLAYMLDAPGRILSQGRGLTQSGPAQENDLQEGDLQEGDLQEGDLQEGDLQESMEAKPVIVAPPRGAGLSYAPQEIGSLSGLLREAGAPPQYAIDRPGQEQKAQLLTLCQEAPPRLLHVASHAVFTPSAPLSSYILLGGEDSGEEDLEGALRRVPLTLEEIFGGAMSLRGTSLAYLSACQSATSEPDVSDETFALSYGLTAAGARAVVATLWSVPDAVACAVAEGFYAAWVGEGRTAAEALQAGREAARRMAERSQADEKAQVQAQAGAYGFILIGNPDARF